MKYNKEMKGVLRENSQINLKKDKGVEGTTTGQGQRDS